YFDTCFFTYSFDFSTYTIKSWQTSACQFDSGQLCHSDHYFVNFSVISFTTPAAIVAPMSLSANLPNSGKSWKVSIGNGLTGLILTIAESPAFRNFGSFSSAAPVCGLIFASNATMVAAT